VVPLLLDNLTYLGASFAGLAVLLALLHVQERLVSRHVAHHLGWRAVLVTGWLGVPLHELSHLLVAKLFGHRVIAWKLLDPDPVTGTLGYVRHAYSRRSLWQLGGTFFIGMAPLLAGAGALALLLCWMLPAEAPQRLLLKLAALGTGPGDAWHGLAAVGQGLASALWEGRSALLPLQLYLAACVAHHLAPSPADLRGALPGLALLAVLAVGATALASSAGVSLLFLPALLLPLVLVLPITAVLLGLWALLAGVVGRMQRPVVRKTITD
jgi:hypothetical protein